MNEDQKFWKFVNEWAKEQNCTFDLQCCDSRESDKPIDGMNAVDMWGWLLKEGEEKDDKKNFGCVIWTEKDGKVELEWKTDFGWPEDE